MKKIIYISILVLLISFAVVFYFIFAAGNDSNTVSLLHMDGTDAATTFTDSASGGTHTWTANGNAQIDTAQSKFGGASGLFDGTGDYLSAPDSEDWNFGSGDFTIDFWTRLTNVSVTNSFLGQIQNTINESFDLYHDTISLSFRYSTNGTSMIFAGERAWSISLNTWYHVAITRNGSSLRMFVDGVQLGATFNVGSDTIFNSNQLLQIGARETGSPLNGWLDELRISKGIARWTSNFTPPGCDYDSECGAPRPSDDMIVFE